MQSERPLEQSAQGLRLGMVVSRYHRAITHSMRDAATEVFTGAGGERDDLVIVEAAGTWELTSVCRALAMAETRSGRQAIDGLVALGCVISGETTHDQYIAQSVTRGLTQIMVETGVPIAFGVLTCQNIEQAQARTINAAAMNVPSSSGQAGAGLVNKGAEAMMAAIETVCTIQRIQKFCKGGFDVKLT